MKVDWRPPPRLGRSLFQQDLSQVGFTLSNSIGHIGPVLVYMAKAPGDPSQWDGSGEVWFKINEWGPDFPGGSIQWPQLGIFLPLFM
ncbi:hypothetical protein PLICBS_006171 [Purpureocillium lilacinum]|uniref:uncharacterized protein n=1 Tax=Purpureocillium lilacinum TaxID=33203 RepID=UPI0020833A9A|nr:hypothetical protein PLICBS_006171 [Purpureocillium lilacinum]